MRSEFSVAVLLGFLFATTYAVAQTTYGTNNLSPGPFKRCKAFYVGPEENTYQSFHAVCRAEARFKGEGPKYGTGTYKGEAVIIPPTVDEAWSAEWRLIFDEFKKKRLEMPPFAPEELKTTWPVKQYFRPSFFSPPTNPQT